MPPENLPAGAKKIFVAAESNARTSSCKDAGDKDECVSKIAWSAVKRKYKKDKDGNWILKAEVASFSMSITKASYDKLTDTRRWKAVASDTDDDLYDDNMTLELYEDFLHRIESKELPPESQRSEFWSGGIPYLSISHYPDLDGKGVPGPVDAVYVDGRTDAGRGMLKASGRFDDTPIGKECFKAISRDLDGNNPVPLDERIRISIAFLDWMHRHKSNGYVFDRSESDDMICIECLKEMISGEEEGKEFLRGQLVHLALTRVPVNTRTSMKVERSMTTRKEDAESIVGDEIAEDLEEEAKIVGKSDALVIKSEEELVEEAKAKKEDDDEEEEEENDKKKKKVKKEDKAEVKKADVVIELDASDVMKVLEEIKSEMTPEPVSAHPLDIAVAELKSVYDESIELPEQEALVAIQEPFEALMLVIQSGVAKSDVENIAEITEDPAIAELKSFVTEQFGLLQSQMAAMKAAPQGVVNDGLPPPPEVPVRRSMAPSLLLNQEQVKEKPKPGSIADIARKSVGLE